MAVNPPPPPTPARAQPSSASWVSTLVLDYPEGRGFKFRGQVWTGSGVCGVGQQVWWTLRGIWTILHSAWRDDKFWPSSCLYKRQWGNWAEKVTEIDWDCARNGHMKVKTLDWVSPEGNKEDAGTKQGIQKCLNGLYFSFSVQLSGSSWNKQRLCLQILIWAVSVPVTLLHGLLFLFSNMQTEQCTIDMNCTHF